MTHIGLKSGAPADSDNWHYMHWPWPHFFATSFTKVPLLPSNTHRYDLDAEESEGGVASGDDVFDTSVLRGEELSDENEFSLPPVFSGVDNTRHQGRKPRKKRVVPTVSPVLLLNF